MKNSENNAYSTETIELYTPSIDDSQHISLLERVLPQSINYLADRVPVEEPFVRTVLL